MNFIGQTQDQRYQNKQPKSYTDDSFGQRAPLKETQVGSSRTLSANEIDYKSHVLYVIPGDNASQRALVMAARSNNIQITNIHTIHPSKRPSWLNGAPILINVQTQQVFKGSHAIKQISDLCETVLNGADNRSGIGYDFNTYEQTTNTCSSGCNIVPILDDESRYSNNIPKPTEIELNRIMEARTTQLSQGTSKPAQLPI